MPDGIAPRGGTQGHQDEKATSLEAADYLLAEQLDVGDV